MTPLPSTNKAEIPLLQVRDLTVQFPSAKSEQFKAVDGLSLSLGHGETLALVGESGCGKSATALAIMRLTRKPGIITGGEVLLEGRSLLELPEKELQLLRGGTYSMIFQEPMTSLNPVLKAGFQVTEGIVRHKKISRKEAEREAVRLLEQVGIPSPRERYHAYPHQLSGGMKQRVMIAMALACRPKLLIADEPTTALDVTIQAEILELIDRLKSELEMSLILITHNLGIVAERADMTMVMYAGRVMETAPTATLLANPLHPYTRGLLASLPQNSPPHTRLPTISGGDSCNGWDGNGCPFSPRCPGSDGPCRTARPDLVEAETGHMVSCWKAPRP